jgi:hypothetical protein
MVLPADGAAAVDGEPSDAVDAVAFSSSLSSPTATRCDAADEVRSTSLKLSSKKGLAMFDTCTEGGNDKQA